MQFDIFISYAHADNDDGWVAAFSDGLSSVYGKLTGVKAKVFLDHESLMTADIWERKIRKALEQSVALIAVVSPSYATSSWCRKEWEFFEAREKILRASGELPEEQGLIFPILLYPFDRGKFCSNELEFVEQVRTRQWIDVSSQLEGTPLRNSQLRSIAESIIDADAEIKVRAQKAMRGAHALETSSTIYDLESHLEWAAGTSPKELTFEEAEQFVASLKSHENEPWRLPTRAELASLIDKNLVAKDPEASSFPLKAPFNAQKFGYLHSRTRVLGGNYILNVRNGHIFNGKGYRAYVRPVRGAIGTDEI